ncbi:MAG: SDR family oxidoreductase [Myxococcota bacterium]
MPDSLTDRRILITGIADENSLALAIARGLKEEGAELVCAGLGPTDHHEGLSEAGAKYLASTQAQFQETVRKELGPDTPTVVMDASIDATVEDAAAHLRDQALPLDGFLHAIAMDKTIRRGVAPPIMEVGRDDFLGCLDVSAYSLLSIPRAFLAHDVLNRGASIVALSYLGGERTMSHAYRNIGIAKAALERLSREMAMELGRSHAIRVNCVRFSPFSASRAGGAIPDLVAAMEKAEAAAPLGNASAQSLAYEVAHLMRPDLEVTGEVRHVDGGYHGVA